MTDKQQTSSFTRQADISTSNALISYVRHRSRVDVIVGVVVATVRNGPNGPEIALGFSRARGAGNQMEWVMSNKINEMVPADRFNRKDGVQIALRRALSAEPLSKAPSSFRDNLAIMGLRAKKYFKNLPVNENYAALVDDSAENKARVVCIQGKRAMHLLHLANKAKSKFDRYMAILNKRTDGMVESADASRS